MANIRFSFRVQDQESIRRLLDHAKSRAMDLSPVLADDVNTLTENYLRKVFESEGREILGRKWEGLTFDSRLKKVKRGFVNKQILEQSGRGRESLYEETPDSIIRVRKRSYERSTRVAYMHLHQTGYTVTRWGGRAFKEPKNVPARPWMPRTFPDSLIKKYENAIAAYIIEAGGRGFSIRTPSGTQSFR